MTRAAAKKPAKKSAGKPAKKVAPKKSSAKMAGKEDPLPPTPPDEPLQG